MWGINKACRALPLSPQCTFKAEIRTRRRPGQRSGTPCKVTRLPGAISRLLLPAPPTRPQLEATGQ